jgi:hypothetical protein
MKIAAAPIAISITPDQKSLLSGSFTGDTDRRGERACRRI